MLEELRFVQGAVARRSVMPSLTHFEIKNGRVIGSNGLVTLSSPIELDLAVRPKATTFIKAIQSCSEGIQIGVATGNRLVVSSGSFRAYVECSEDYYPEIEPEGEMIEITEPFLPTLKILERFVAEDDSRKWARGVLFSGQSAFATNNIILVESWLEKPFPVNICIPDPTIQELLRIGEEPERIQVSDSSMTFHFSGERWLHSKAYSTAWPNVSNLLDSSMEKSVLNYFPEKMFQTISSLAPFADELNRIFLSSGLIKTSQMEGVGASADLHIADKGIYNLRQLLLLDGVAEMIDFSSYPQPCYFIGERLRGLLVGIKE